MELFIAGLIVGLVLALGVKSFVNTAKPKTSKSATKHVDALTGEAEKKLKAFKSIADDVAEIDRRSAEATRSIGIKIKELLN